MRYSFTKLQAAANDFVLFDFLATAATEFSAEQIRHIADRRRGIGCDQVLILEKGDTGVIHYRIYNADGEEVMQCGNGACCVALYLHMRGLFVANADDFQLQTASGELSLRFTTTGWPQVALAVPDFTPQNIPVDFPEQKMLYELPLAGEERQLTVLTLGNPHAVIVVDDVQNFPVQHIGKLVQQLPHFPESVNVGFMQCDTPEHIHLRVVERGVGETPACGSGAAAAVVAGKIRGLLHSDVQVAMPGGVLGVSWQNETESVWLSSEAKYCFAGSIEL